MTYVLAGVAFLLILVFLVMGAVRSTHEDRSGRMGVLEKSLRKIHLVDTMRISLLVSAEAEKSSVLAETDEASQAFADQSAQASAAVERARLDFEELLDGDKFRQEMELFRQFNGCWVKLQEIDRELLPLAVQNTNLKALRLSFIPAVEAIRRMETALGQLMDGSDSSPDAPKIMRLAARSLIGACHIYTLQAPHIAETSSTGMDEMEAAMKRLDAQVDESFSTLDALVDQPGRSYFDAAKASYAEFQKINAKIIELSRQNSNSLSSAISLGQKRNVMLQCLDSLAALQGAVQQGTALKATK